MTRKIINAADTPVDAYNYWHERWAEIMTERYKEEAIKAGVAGHSFSEYTPDVPGGSGCFHYAFAADGSLIFTDYEGEAVVEYPSYGLGFQAFRDPNFDIRPYIQEGTWRYIKKPEIFGYIKSLLPYMRQALEEAITETEVKYDIEFPKYSLE